MTKKGKQARSREANKVKNKLPQVTSLANQVAQLGSIVAKLNANSATATSEQVQQLITIMTQLNASAVLHPEASFSLPEFQIPKSQTGASAGESSQLVEQVDQVMLALPDSLKHAIDGLSDKVSGLDFSRAAQTVDVELEALAQQVPSIFNGISVASAVDVVEQAAKQVQGAAEPQQQFCVDVESLSQALPALMTNLDVSALPTQLLETGKTLSDIQFTEVLKGDLSSLTAAAPTLLTQFGFDEAANVVTQFAPAMEQLDLKGIVQGDLQSLQQALPSLLDAVDLGALNQTLAQQIPALSQLDLAGLAQGELGSLVTTLPNLLDAAGMEGAADTLSAALPALQQLDLGAIAEGDVQSLLQNGPALLDAFDMQGASQALGAALPIAEKLDFKGLMSGELGSLVDAAPEVLRAFELGDAADKLQAAVPGLKQLNLKQIASGDVSSLMAAGPSLLKAFELDGAAGVLENALPALEKLDVDAILGGDIQSLVSAGPQLLNAFGLQDAASVLEQHADLLSNIDIKGVLKGDLSSLTKSLPDLFGEFGFEGMADDLSESFSELETDIKDNQPKAKKGRKKRGKKRKNKTNHSGSTAKPPQQASKGKGNKPFLRLLDGGKAPSATAQLNADAEQPKKAKGKAKKIKTMAAANDPSVQKLGRFSAVKNGKLSSVFKGSKRLLGRVAAPLSVALGAFDAMTALTDPALSAKEKTTQVSAAAGGAGGALAGAAAGAALGSVVPVVGTAIGGLVGGALGAMGGESIGGWLGDKLGGLFSSEAQPDETTSTSVGSDHSRPQAVAQPATPNAGSAASEALDFVKSNVINELNLATGTAAVLASQHGVANTKVHRVSKAGDMVGRALNAHTVWETMNNDTLSLQQKSGVIGSTLGGMFSADAVTGAMSKSKNPYVKMAAPMAGYLTNNLVGSAIKGWFTDEKSKTVAADAILDPNSLSTQPTSGDSAANSTLQPTRHGGSVTVNANITVNAKEAQQAQEIAQQVKRILEQQQQQAEQALSARYYNHVA
ncbi:phage tail protein [Pseudoalteromonas sp. SCSIO 43201]|uniref:phage tail protein n=1 Tax=Pseudoalteromonas sp. SCSIO 43201 TaxID=2822842 RepID=UPI00207513C7|nr:phage tail protein [Pseudoalteromonas sp. SCSIO 43201]USD29493.1 phage tail protein [Pseudoalteromonas sp. SCSIO 43201]